MQTFTFTIFCITLVCSIVLVNGQPDSAKSIDEYAEEIRAKVAEVTSTVVADQEKNNSKQGLLGSVLNGLVLFLKALVVPPVTGTLNTPSLLIKTVVGALNGLAKGGLLGLVGGIAKSTANGFREISGKQITEGFLQGLVSDPKQNEKIMKKLKDALSLSFDKVDAEGAGKGNLGANLSYVADLVVLLVTFAYSFVPFLLKILGSAANGLLKGLIEGLKQKGLIGGLLHALKSLLDNLATSSIEGFGTVLSNILA